MTIIKVDALNKYYGLCPKGHDGHNEDMYLLATKMLGQPVISLQTGQTVAALTSPVVKMESLELAALGCKSEGQRSSQVLMPRDIRQFAREGVIVDSKDDLSEPEDIVRLKPDLKRDFNPIGCQVVNESGHKLGRVSDYTVNISTFMIQKLYVHQPLMKSLLYSNLVIDRNQIAETAPKQITVRDATVKDALLGAKAAPRPGD